MPSSSSRVLYHHQPPALLYFWHLEVLVITPVRAAILVLKLDRRIPLHDANSTRLSEVIQMLILVSRDGLAHESDHHAGLKLADLAHGNPSVSRRFGWAG